jgi:membrane-bound metal-dependent hydrolase YbcI (DUF457 family)
MVWEDWSRGISRQVRTDPSELPRGRVLGPQSGVLLVLYRYLYNERVQHPYITRQASSDLDLELLWGEENMPDLLFHMLLPALLAIVAGVDRKKAIILMPFAVLPDLDALFMAHHLIFHSLIATSLIAFPGLLYCRWARPKYFTAGVIATLYFYSHLLLDLFSGTYVALFWPLSNIGYTVFINLTVTHQSLWPKIDLGAIVSQHLVFNNGRLVDASMVNAGSVVLAFLFVPAVIYGNGRRKQRQQTNTSELTKDREPGTRHQDMYENMYS